MWRQSLNNNNNKISISSLVSLPLLPLPPDAMERESTLFYFTVTCLHAWRFQVRSHSSTVCVVLFLKSREQKMREPGEFLLIMVRNTSKGCAPRCSLPVCVTYSTQRVGSRSVCAVGLVRSWSYKYNLSLQGRRGAGDGQFGNVMSFWGVSPSPLVRWQVLQLKVPHSSRCCSSWTTERWSTSESDEICAWQAQKALLVSTFKYAASVCQLPVARFSEEQSWE